MKTLNEVVSTLQARGIDPHAGKLVVNPVNIEMAKQAVLHGIAVAISGDIPAGEVTFFPNATLRRLIVPEDEEFRAWRRVHQ